MAVVSAPLDWVESVSELRLTDEEDQRLQELMDANNEGRLTESERSELERLAGWSEKLSLIRAGALQILGRSPR